MRQAARFDSFAALASTVTLALVVAFAAPAAAKERTLKVEVHKDHHANLTLTVDSGWVSGVVDTFSPSWMSCDSDHDDRELVELVGYLDQHGDGARGVVTKHGERIHGTRRAGKLELRVDQRDGQEVDITLPWRFADCILGRDVSVQKLWDDAVRDGNFEILVTGHDGTVRITMED